MKIRNRKWVPIVTPGLPSCYLLKQRYCALSARILSSTWHHRGNIIEWDLASLRTLTLPFTLLPENVRTAGGGSKGRGGIREGHLTVPWEGNKPHTKVQVDLSRVITSKACERLGRKKLFGSLCLLIDWEGRKEGCIKKKESENEPPAIFFPFFWNVWY